MGGDIMRFDLMNYSSSMPLAFVRAKEVAEVHVQAVVLVAKAHVNPHVKAL